MYIIQKDMHEHGSLKYKNVAEKIEKKHVKKSLENPEMAP
jgi:hypothetical protein